MGRQSQMFPIGSPSARVSVGAKPLGIAQPEAGSRGVRTMSGAEGLRQIRFVPHGCRCSTGRPRAAERVQPVPFLSNAPDAQMGPSHHSSVQDSSMADLCMSQAYTSSGAGCVEHGLCCVVVMCDCLCAATLAEPRWPRLGRDEEQQGRELGLGLHLQKPQTFPCSPLPADRPQKQLQSLMQTQELGLKRGGGRGTQFRSCILQGCAGLWCPPPWVLLCICFGC